MSVIFLLLKPVRLRVVKWVICSEATLCCIHVFSFSQTSSLYVGLEVDTQQLNVPKISISNICSMSIYVSRYQIQILIAKNKDIFINLKKLINISKYDFFH